MENNTKPLKIALHGMDSRAVRTMMLFLQGPCKGVAYVVLNAEDADLDIFDGDSPAFKKLLEKQTQQNALKPTIVFSFQDFAQEGCLCLKKPVKAGDMLLALEQAKTIIAGLTKPAAEPQTSLLPTLKARLQQAPNKKDPQPIIFNQDESNKTSKHQTALRLDEKNLQKQIGAFEFFDVKDPSQLINASYNPKNFYQGYFQTALDIARSNKQIMLLESDWCPVTLFPRTQEIWLEAGDQELKGFAGIKLNRKIMSADLFITRVDPETVSFDRALNKFQSVESFLWKLACWTSNGRYPQEIDYKYPVYLKNWPNFSRLLVTPHAFRIAALLIQGPRTMANIAETLKVKPQYVFMFISAAHAIGLADQVKRAADSLVEVPYIPPNTKNQGLLGQLISKLHSS